jgi:hypothetical protein
MTNLPSEITADDWQTHARHSIERYLGKLYAWGVTKAGYWEGKFSADAANAAREITKCKAYLTSWKADYTEAETALDLSLLDKFAIAEGELKMWIMRQADNDKNVSLYTRNKDMMKLFEGEREFAKQEAARCNFMIPWWRKEVERLDGLIEAANKAAEQEDRADEDSSNDPITLQPLPGESNQTVLRPVETVNKAIA